jgi:hypothetical protein
MKAYWLVAVALGLSSCSSSNTAMMSDAAAAPEVAAPEDFNATAADLDCTRNSEWTAVGLGLTHFKNVLGHTNEMLQAARSADGGTFPVGTIVVLNPAEAMIKRGAGFSPPSNDWEFFALTVSDAGTIINTRGGGSSVMNARGPCLGCHAMAQPQFDLVCGDPMGNPLDGGTTAHGCNDLPVPVATLAARMDPRCQ